MNFDFENRCKMNLRIITKNHAAESKIASAFKIDFRADWTHESIPTAWELTLKSGISLKILPKVFSIPKK